MIILLGCLIYSETNGYLNLPPLTIELLGTTTGVTLAIAIGEFAKQLTLEYREKNGKKRVLKELERLVVTESYKWRNYYTPVWESILSSGKEDQFQEDFEEQVFEVYREINRANKDFKDEEVDEIEIAIPVIKLIGVLVKEFGIDSQYRRVKKHMDEMKADYPELWVQLRKVT